MFTTVIEGRPPRGPNEIVLGGDTLDRIDHGVGDAVGVEGPAGTRRFVVVGRGVFPSPDDPLPFADGAALTAEAVDALRLGEASLDSFSHHLVRWAPGVDHDAARARLGRKYELVGSSAPPEIERLTQVDELPRVLSGFLALLAVFAVGHALLTAVHRRRYDFAVLQNARVRQPSAVGDGGMAGDRARGRRPRARGTAGPRRRPLVVGTRRPGHRRRHGLPRYQSPRWCSPFPPRCSSPTPSRSSPVGSPRTPGPRSRCEPNSQGLSGGRSSLGGREVRLQQRDEIGSERGRDLVADALPGHERRARDRLGQRLAVVDGEDRGPRCPARRGSARRPRRAPRCATAP